MDCSLQITADVLPPNALFVQIKLVVLLDSHYFCCENPGVYVTACVCTCFYVHTNEYKSMSSTLCKVLL